VLPAPSSEHGSRNEQVAPQPFKKGWHVRGDPPQDAEQQSAPVVHELPISPHDDGCVVVVVLDVVVVVPPH
jgi:hypothetical protein